jgi:hypothetical protein
MQPTDANNILVRFEPQEGQYLPNRYMVVPRFNYVELDGASSVPVSEGVDALRYAVATMREVVGREVPVQYNGVDKPGIPSGWSRTVLPLSLFMPPRLYPVFEVRADRVTGEWLDAEPRETAELRTFAEWASMPDTRESHCDHYEHGERDGADCSTGYTEMRLLRVVHVG